MKILIFDMDGVLIHPQGYHSALKDTVRLIGKTCGISDLQLDDAQIAQFEALGISSEWLSSAMSHAMITLLMDQGTDKGVQSSNAHPTRLDLAELFNLLSEEPLGRPPVERGYSAIGKLAKSMGIPPKNAQGIVIGCESIEDSPTFNYFQEMILGSIGFSETYQKPAQLQTQSYLHKFDTPILSSTLAGQIMDRTKHPEFSAAIMTNRPSRGPGGYSDMPDAGIGASIAGLGELPKIGLGELAWLANETGRAITEVTKPSWPHALSAILAAEGMLIEDSLIYCGQDPRTFNRRDLHHLDNSTISVFEDTPAGLVAVQHAVYLLNEVGIKVEIQKVGIAVEPAKVSALSKQGAVVFSNINQALRELDHF